MVSQLGRKLKGMAQPHLEETLKALYDSEINATISWLWDGGVNFTFISYMESEQITPGTTSELLRNWPRRFTGQHALLEFPNSNYAKRLR
jgi:hypothetical protein